MSRSRLLLAMVIPLALGACSNGTLPRQADRAVSQGLAVAQLDSPGEVAYVALGTVAEEFRFNATVDVVDRVGVAAPIAGNVNGPLPTRGTQVARGDVLFSMAPSVEMKAAAAELEAALLARQLGIGDVDRLEARVAAATHRAEELGLPTDGRALEPFPEEIIVEAPVSGTVLVAHPPEGGQAVQGDILVELGDIAELLVTLSVSSEMAQLVEVGSSVVVATRDGRGEPVDGTVSSIEEPEEAEAENANEVRLAIELESDPFEYGTGVRVAITGVAHQNVLWLPPQVIRSHDGKTFIIVVEGETARRVEVVVGVQTEEQVEVSGLLVEGQKVVGP